MHDQLHPLDKQVFLLYYSENKKLGKVSGARAVFSSNAYRLKLFSEGTNRLRRSLIEIIHPVSRR